MVSSLGALTLLRTARCLAPRLLGAYVTRVRAASLSVAASASRAAVGGAGGPFDARDDGNEALTLRRVAQASVAASPQPRAEEEEEDEAEEEEEEDVLESLVNHRFLRERAQRARPLKRDHRLKSKREFLRRREVYLGRASLKGKSHCDLPVRLGTVKWFDADRHHGFVTPDDGGPDVFVHRTAVASSAYPLRSDERVRFSVLYDVHDKRYSRRTEAHFVELDAGEDAVVKRRHSKTKFFRSYMDYSEYDADSEYDTAASRSREDP